MGTGYRSHFERTLRVYDIVEAIAEDGSFDVEMRLVRKAPSRLEWRVLRSISGDPVEGMKPEKPSRYELKWGGPRAKWTVKDKRTGKALVEGYDRLIARFAPAQEDAPAGTTALRVSSAAFHRLLGELEAISR